MGISCSGAEALKALGNLEPAYREVLVLRYVEDLSLGEIAAILGETENAVSVRIHRGLKKAKEFLEHGKKI
ncbi:MAG: sigma-70 family RNA polymerase sigma factor [Candidatus Ryanbacteria bacterium]|nr:sigma-70 family RNA polymerase sigma factor [Candidatus Ryanbacteria bacterium]